MKTLALIVSGMLLLSSFPVEARGFYHPRVSIGVGYYPYGWYDPWLYGYPYGYGPYSPRVPAAQDEGAPERLFVYPAGGQSETQTAQDRKECNDWAVAQSGIDPATAKKREKTQHLDEYNRATIACLEGRHYTVN